MLWDILIPFFALFLELGIDTDVIKNKFIAILTQRGIKEAAEDDDMTGTILTCVVFGVLLGFTGRMHFGNIYGFGVSGACCLWLLINLLTKNA